MPHTRVHSGDQMPPPRGHFTGTKMTEGRQKHLQLSNKIFINITKTEKHCQRIYYEQKPRQSGGNRYYKITECSAFLRHETYKAFYKKRSHLLRLLHHDHFTDMHHRSPYKLTYLRQVKVVGLSFSFYFILCCCIESPIQVLYFIVKHNNKIHSYIQSLNPILKILKFEYFKYGKKFV